jgi:hypothetical protein
MAKSDRKTIDKVFILLGVAATVVLLAVGGVAWKGANFAQDSVRDELAAQKISFPPKGSPAIAALPAADQAKVNQYAGQLVDDGPKAKVYANNFIGVHLSEIAGGKTYAEVSSEALKDPSNAKLQGQKQALFQGETLRGLLLGDGYAYWTFGQIMQYAAVVAFAGAAVMALLVLAGLGHLSRLKR